MNYILVTAITSVLFFNALLWLFLGMDAVFRNLGLNRQYAWIMTNSLFIAGYCFYYVL